MFLIHGYAAHFNRPTYGPFLKELMDKGIAVATIDLEGHGYSEGRRCFISSVNDYLDDLELLVDLIQNGDTHLTITGPS